VNRETLFDDESAKIWSIPVVGPGNYDFRLRSTDSQQAVAAESEGHGASLASGIKARGNSQTFAAIGFSSCSQETFSGRTIKPHAQAGWGF
jgi:hypothetical protein